MTRDEIRAEIANNQALWRKLQEYLEARLTSARLRNDHTMPEDARNRLLGRISEIKSLQTLDSLAPAVEEADDLTP